MRIVTADMMRALDRRTIEDIGIPGVVLMENAGRGAANFLLEHFDDFGRGPVAVVCGAGNNGGDGFVIARVLHGKSIPVRIYSLVSQEQIRGDAAVFFQATRKIGIPCRFLLDETSDQAIQDEWAASSCIVDAIFGTGLARDVEGRYRGAIEGIRNSGRPVLAVDMPSGINADTGEIMGSAVRADWTVTFGAPKRGLFLYPGASYCGVLECLDIGIPPSLLDSTDCREETAEPGPLLAELRRKPDTHKGTYGHLLVLAGSGGKTGAACLCSESALRCGAGLVTLGIPSPLNGILEEKLTEVMTLPLLCGGQGTLSQMALPAVHAFMRYAGGLVIGPGIGVDPDTESVIRDLWQNADKPMVWDADALTLLAANPDLRGRHRAKVIVTPHPGEMSRLLGKPVAWVQANRVEAVRVFSGAWGVVTVLKGARTLVAEPGGRLRINLTGNPGMASGGMGDVLTGMIGALMLQLRDPFDAATLGVWVHGMAGDAVAAERGPFGFLASEVMDRIPSVFKEMMGKAA